jgi:hypothetical protein
MTVVIGNVLVNVVNAACPAPELKPEPVDVVGLVVDAGGGIGDRELEVTGDGSEALLEPVGIKVEPPLVVHQLFCGGSTTVFEVIALSGRRWVPVVVVVRHRDGLGITKSRRTSSNKLELQIRDVYPRGVFKFTRPSLADHRKRFR